MGSTRLPGKVLSRVLDIPLLQFQVERLRDISGIDCIVIATTTNPLDDPIVALCDRLGYQVFRGSESDVLGRYYAAAKSFKADCIVRINSDCPIIDPEVVSHVIGSFQSQVRRYDYTSNILEKGYPIGFHTEIFSMDALTKAHFNSDDGDEREHVTPYIYRNPDIFKLASIVPETDMSHFRWTLDYPADLEVITRIIEGLYPQNPHFGLDDMISFANRNPDIGRLNAFITKEQTI